MELDLSKIKNVHFIGIGGIGISAIARMMKGQGKIVTGQDMQENEIVIELKKIGFDIKIGQSYQNIPTDADLIVYTIAIEYYDPELFNKLKERNDIPIKSYPEMLGVISKNKYTIAICGTHGKTTTTGMISQVLVDGGKDPTVVVGSLLKGGTNFIKGESDPASPYASQGGLFVVEACEYRRSFLNINPKILVITNIDEDHLDYYKDIEDIKSAFRAMVLKVPVDGYVICNPDDKNIKEVIDDIKAKIINWQDYFESDLKLKIPGIHNKKDAAGALAVATILGVSKDDALKYLADFSGTWKRFEFRGELKNGALLYDDYAHHPTEIKATLEGFRELYPKNDGLSADMAEWKLIVVFQPHLFSRTKLLLNDFANSFQNADEVLILPIYYAREFDDGSINSEILEKEINKYSHNAKSFPDFLSLEKFLEVRLPKMDVKNVIVTMGAGEASKIGDFLLSNNNL